MTTFDLPMFHRDRYSPMQQKILDYLKDGEQHDRRDVIQHCFHDPKYVTGATVDATMYQLRKVLPHGILLLTERSGHKTLYRLARHLNLNDE